jgi:hypothetical protein
VHWTCPCHPPPTLPRSRCLRQCVVQDPIHPSVRPSIRLSICMSVFVWLSIRFLSLLKSVSMCYCSRSKFYSRRTHSLTPFSRDNTRKRKRVTCTYRLHLWPFNQFILDILTKKIDQNRAWCGSEVFSRFRIVVLDEFPIILKLWISFLKSFLTVCDFKQTDNVNFFV